MDPQIYKLIHFIGIMMTFLGFGALVARAMLSSDSLSVRKFGGIVSGIGLVCILLGGFGMQAKYKEVIHITDWWIISKIVIWVLIGGLTSLIIRKPHTSKLVWIALLILGTVAAYLGLFGRGL